MTKKYYLHITTWARYAPGARHYYGRIHSSWGQLSEHEEYDVTRQTGPGLRSQFNSEEDVVKHAIKSFFRLKLKGMLYIGDSSTAQPQRVLIVPKSLLQKAKRENDLWHLMEGYYELGGYDPWTKYGKEMNEINKEWEELWKDNKS